MNMYRRYPGLKNVVPEHRLRTFKQLVIQDQHLCYLINTNTDGTFLRSPYYGDENWKMRYWRKALEP